MPVNVQGAIELSTLKSRFWLSWVYKGPPESPLHVEAVPKAQTCPAISGPSVSPHLSLQISWEMIVMLAFCWTFSAIRKSILVASSLSLWYRRRWENVGSWENVWKIYQEISEAPANNNSIVAGSLLLETGRRERQTHTPHTSVDESLSWQTNQPYPRVT